MHCTEIVDYCQYMIYTLALLEYRHLCVYP
jgi:hypothetical protein